MQPAAVARARTAQEAPEHLFHHISQSIDNGIRTNMLAEVQYGKNPDIYWIANITMVCGHLLRMRFIGSDQDKWYDMTKQTICYLGWCQRTNEDLYPPPDVGEIENDNLVQTLRDAIENQQSIPFESIENSGSVPIDRISQGMKVEVQSELHPYKYWIATIIKNVGGRLLLRYDAPEDIENDFWLFYSSPRVSYVGYTEFIGNEFELEHPKHEKYSKFNSVDWNACKLSSIKAAKLKHSPKSLFTVTERDERHHFKIGMKLEALNPSTMSEICPATVTRVYDNCYFVVSLDNELDDSKSRNWLCYSSHPYIFPVGWAQANNIDICSQLLKKYHNNFSWKKYLEVTKSSSAPNDYFSKKQMATKTGFKVGMKLEAVDPLNPNNISVATIKTITKHLLLITIEYNGNSHWFSHDSTDLYYAGWCENNNVTVCTPETIKAQSENVEHIKLLQSYNVPAQIKEKWCDRVYFNYKCYSGPLISKNKLSQLPRHVGPGPLSLVLREVLNMIISVAYKPASLLKEWEIEGTPPANVKYEKLKAKLKNHTHYGNVVTITNCEELTKYCKTMCEKLQACPYIFGTTEITAQCPEQCSVVNKSKFRKKTRKKGLHFMTIRARERRAALESENRSKDDSDEKVQESGNESDHSRSSSVHVSDAGTRPNSPENVTATRKRPSKPILPPLEMKTRGAKLPNFAKQIKEGHWDRKEVGSLYNKALPRKHYSESDSDNFSCNSIDSKNDMGKISDVSDAEEPELKKLRVSPMDEILPSDIKPDLNSCSYKIDYQSMNPNIGAWSINDVYMLLSKYNEFNEIAERLREEEFDGMALIMLNLPTMQESLKMKYEPAMELCKLVTSLKWSYFQYHFNTKINQS